MFVLGKSDLYFWPVKVDIAKDGGGFEKMSFDAKFKRVTTAELERLLDAKQSNDDKFVREVMVDWKGIVSASGEAVQFSVTSLDLLLEMPGVSMKIVQAYLDSVSGEKVKN